MGKHSNLGPIDPQIGGIPANGVLKEFEQAKREVKADPALAEVWAVILRRYHPTFIGECEKVVRWSKRIVSEWLATGMFHKESKARDKARKIVTKLFRFGDTVSHSLHINAESCRGMGLKVLAIEDHPDLQDRILTVHHAYMHTLANTNAVKIVENHLGRAMVLHARLS